MLTRTPTPPYYAVIFSSIKSEDQTGYQKSRQKMQELAANQPGFIGMDAFDGDMSVIVTYWKDMPSIRAWQENKSYLGAQKEGRERWYKQFSLRVARVEKEFDFQQEKDWLQD